MWQSHEAKCNRVDCLQSAANSYCCSDKVARQSVKHVARTILCYSITSLHAPAQWTMFRCYRHNWVGHFGKPKTFDLNEQLLLLWFLCWAVHLETNWISKNIFLLKPFMLSLKVYLYFYQAPVSSELILQLSFYLYDTFKKCRTTSLPVIGWLQQPLTTWIVWLTSHKVYKIKSHILDLDALRDATHGFASPPYLNRGSLSCE